MKLSTALLVFFVLCCAITALFAKPANNDDKKGINLKEYFNATAGLDESSYASGSPGRRIKRQGVIVANDKCPKNHIKVTLNEKTHCLKCSKTDLCE